MCANADEVARDAIDAALAAEWAILGRPLRDGGIWGGYDDVETVEEWARPNKNNPASLCRGWRGWIEDADNGIIDLSDAERAALLRGIAVASAAALEHIPDAPPSKRSRNR